MSKAVFTIAELSAVLPAGRKPTSSMPTLTGPRLFQRLFSSATASFTALLNFSLQLVQLANIRRAHINFHPSLKWNRIH